MKTKICTGCKEEKPINNFYKQIKGKLGVRSRCNTCIHKYKIEYTKNNKELLKEERKQYYKNNKERTKREWRKYYKKNKNKLIEAGIVYYYKNKKHCLLINKKRQNAYKVTLADNYIKRLLITNMKVLKFKNIPQILIEVKRLELKTIRLLKERRKQNA